MRWNDLKIIGGNKLSRIRTFKIFRWNKLSRDLNRKNVSLLVTAVLVAKTDAKIDDCFFFHFFLFRNFLLSFTNDVSRVLISFFFMLDMIRAWDFFIFSLYVSVLYQFFISLHEKKVVAYTSNWGCHFTDNLHTTLSKWKSSVVVACQSYSDICSCINEELCHFRNFSRQLSNLNFMPFFIAFDCKFIKRVIRLLNTVQLLRWFWYPNFSIIIKSSNGSSELENVFLWDVYSMDMKFKIHVYNKTLSSSLLI